MDHAGQSRRKLDVGAGQSLAVHHIPSRVGLPVLEVEELRHNKGNAATYGIWRVRGAAGQAVLKIYRPGAPGYAGCWPTSTEPTHWNYWRREPLAYAEGLTSTVYAEAGVSGPEMLETNVRADGMVELWLEYVPGSGGFEWAPSRIARFAYELGAGQDSFTDGLMDPDLLPEIAEGCVDGYLKGLRDGGWSGSEDAVRVAVGACGAAKFSWFGPAVLGRAVSNDVGSSNYSQDESAELVVKRVAGLVTLIADWARVAGSR